MDLFSGGFHQGGSATNGATQTMPVVHNMCPLHVNSESRRGTASVTNRQTNGQTWRQSCVYYRILKETLQHLKTYPGYIMIHLTK